MAENKENKYKKIADEIIQIVGKGNIESITHCVTRLRLTVRDRKIIDDSAIENVDEVKGVFFTGGQYQIILGTGIVNKVFAQIDGFDTSENRTEGNENKPDKPENWLGKLQRGIRVLSDIFLPIVPILGATGLFLGLKGVMYNPAVLSLFGLTPKMIPASLTTIIDVLTGTAFQFLPAFICWSAFKKFGGSPIIGFLIGIMLVSPLLPNAYDVASGAAKPIMFLNHIPVEGYQGSILTALFTGILGAKLEKKLRAVMPNAMDLIFTPFVVVIVMLALALFGFGPIVHYIELGLVYSIRNFLFLPFGIGGFVIGALYPLLVMTGLHQMSIVVETSLLATTHFNPMITVEAMYGFSNAAVCLALSLRNRNSAQKSAGISAMVTQMLGVSEPALFGVVLRAGLPALLVMVLCSGIGGAVLSFLHIQANSYGLAVMLSPLMYLYNANQLLIYILIGILTFIGAFIATNVFAIPKKNGNQLNQPTNNEQNSIQVSFKNPATNESSQFEFLAPVNGPIIDLEKVADPVFAQKLMGDGFAVEPTDGRIIAPANGKISMIAPTKHAIGMNTDDGTEILLHLGIDTVSMDGKPFHVHVKVGDSVETGQLIADMNIAEIKQAGKKVTVMLIFTDNQNKVTILKVKKHQTAANDIGNVSIQSEQD